MMSLKLGALLVIALLMQIVEVQVSCRPLPPRLRMTPMPLRLFDADGAGVRPLKGHIPGCGVVDVMVYAAGVVIGMRARTS